MEKNEAYESCLRDFSIKKHMNTLCTEKEMRKRAVYITFETIFSKRQLLPVAEHFIKNHSQKQSNSSSSDH